MHSPVNAFFKTMIAPAILLLVANTAVGAEWGWNRQNPANFGGQVILFDESGTSSAFDRFDGNSSAPLWGSSAVQSPIVVAGAASGPPISVGHYRTGATVPKLMCPAGTEWRVALSVANACWPGTSHNIAGIHLSYDENPEQWNPTMHIHVTGFGWLNVLNSDCGVVSAIETCE